MYQENTGQDKLDARRYFPRNCQKELILTQEDSAPRKDVEFVEDDDRGGSRGGYKSKRRGGYQRRDEPVYVAKNASEKKTEEFCFEDCNMVSYILLGM